MFYIVWSYIIQYLRKVNMQKVLELFLTWNIMSARVSPRVPMEFLSRSWSASALKVTEALAPAHSQPSLSPCMPSNGSVPEETCNHTVCDELSTLSKNQFSFASSDSYLAVLFNCYLSIIYVTGIFLVNVT